jgi:hypothetical protein
MKTKIETYWVYEVFSIEGDKKRSVVVVPCDTLAEATAGAFKDATYYIGECGYQVAVGFEEKCKACEGMGLVKRRVLLAPCPKCKGKPIIQVLPVVSWMPSEHVMFREVTREQA